VSIPRVLVGLGAVTLGGGAAAQLPAEQTFAADLAALCAPEMGGRAPGSPGGRRAEDFLAARFAAIGLGLPEGLAAYRQEFPVPASEPPRCDPARTALRFAEGGRGVALRPGVDFLPFGFSVEGEVRGPLLAAGHGLSSPEPGLDDFAGLDLGGAVVLLRRGAPGGRDPAFPRAAHRDALRFEAKIRAASARGAAAVLLTDAEASAAAEPGLLRRALTARGSAGVPAAWITRAAAARLLAAGGPVTVAVGFAGRPPAGTSANLVGLLPGADPRLAADWIVVGAHHDHLGDGRAGSRRPAAVPTLHPGADDNASGCAALLLLAEQLARGPRLRRSLAFVAFGAEEPGRVGSQAFVRAGPIPAGRIVAMVNLSMVGRASPDRLRVEGAGSADGLRELVAAAATEVGLAPEIRDLASLRSDHASFLERGIPALFVHSGLHHEYHTPDDVPERVLVPEAVGVVRWTAAVLRRLGDRSAPLRPIAGEGRRPSRAR
jgi:hypothetical protein